MRSLVDGTDIRRFDLGAYRRRLGVVPQEPHLFIGTVRDNIAYGRPDATDAEVEAAARSVGASDAIAGLTGGFRHPVDERGRNLSAGQRQLISLARAELVDPDMLLLDEATAALDPAAEACRAGGHRPAGPRAGPRSWSCAPADHRGPGRPDRRDGPRPGGRERSA